MSDALTEHPEQEGPPHHRMPGVNETSRASGRDSMAALRKWVIVILIAGVIVGAVMAFGVMPALIRAAYRGEGLDVLVKALEHRGEHSVSFYLAKWYKLAAAAIGAWVGLGLLILGVTSRTFAQRIVGAATPGRLGAIRVLICLLMIRMAWGDDLHNVLSLPASSRKPMGIMDWVYAYVPGFTELVRSATALTAFKAVTISLLVLALIGWRTRWALALGVLCYLPLVGIQRSYYWFNHSGLIPAYVAIVLCFTRCGDGWSVDRLRRLWRDDPSLPPKDEPQPYYAWAIYAVWLVIALPYVAAGMSKLRNGGWFWWHGVNMQTILYTDALRPGMNRETFVLAADWLPQIAFTVMGVMTIATEIGMGLVLVSRLARMILPVMTVGMHLGIEWLQKILFLDLIIIQVVFYDWAKVRRWIGAKLNARFGRLQVFHDPRSLAQQRWVRILPGFDLFNRLTFIESPGEMGIRVACQRAGDCAGASAARAIARVLPWGWIAYPILWIPGIAGALGRLTSLNDSRGLEPAERLRATPRAEASGDNQGIPAIPLWRRLLGPGAVTFIVALLLGCWSMQVEYYPFTAMQMFSKSSHEGVVHWYRIEQTTDGGWTGEAFLDKMGFGASRYRGIIQNGFTPHGRQTCIDTLVMCGKYWNERHPGERRVTRLEVQKRSWDFINDRHNQEYGPIVDRIVVTFDPVTGDATELADSSAG